MPSEKCRPVYQDLEKMKPEQLTESYCLTKPEKMRLVGCMSVKLRDERGLDFGDSVREAWKFVKELCK